MLVPEAFRPELVITGGQLHLRLDACDLATAPGAGAAVVTARTVPRLLLTHHDAEALCAKVSLQDRRPSFRRLLGLCLPDAKKRGSMTGDETSDQANDMTRGQRVVSSAGNAPATQVSVVDLQRALSQHEQLLLFTSL